MNFVLDTNAVSETRKPRPNAGLLDWHTAQDPAHLFLTTITLAEVWQGFHALDPKHPDYERIKIFATALPGQYRILNFDARAAAIWGEITGRTKSPLPLRDSLIAAIARSRGDSRHGAVRARRMQGGQSVEIKLATTALTKVSAGQIRPRAPDEIQHARPLDRAVS